MGTLLLRLAAPMQSWGSSSKFDRRLTDKEPTKSGVIGMIACAMGIRRENSLAEFVQLRYGVRVDQQGTMGMDFQMVHEQKKSKNSSSWVTYRYYLYDAAFLVGIEGTREILTHIEESLRHPVFPIYLGRRSCPPVGPISLGIRNGNLQDTLREEPWQAGDWYKKHVKKPDKVFLEIVRDAMLEEKGSYSVRDVPITFSQKRREYGFRNVIREQISVASVWKQYSDCVQEAGVPTRHNPMELLEENNVSIKSKAKH